MKKLNIKSKIKNFFEVDLEEDLKKEPTKKFEQINLFTISRNNLFFGIIASLILVNILVFFNINHFYIRAVLSFLFLISVPGLLIMLIFRIRNIDFWEYLVYTIGLSAAFIMFAGLNINWLLPALHITDKPLALIPVLTGFNIYLMLFWFLAFIRNQDFKPLEIKFPKLDTTNQIFFLIPLIFPVLSILGALFLNNHGPNYLTMIMLGGIAIYVFCVVWFRDKLNENVYPWALFFITLSLLFSFSMRSWYVNGGDINREYGIFQLIQSNYFWDMNGLSNTYNSMLSVSILPTILSLFSNMNNHFIFKSLYPLIFVSISLIVYLISRKYFAKIICFISSFFFISQQIFFNWTDLPTRQEIALIFFGLMLLTLFNRNLNKKVKHILFTIFGFSMIVSHYSTSYIALAIFLLAYILSLIYLGYEHKIIKKEKLPQSKKTKFHLTGTLIILLLIFGFLWYNQVTDTSEGLIGFAKNSLDNLGNMFNEEIQADGKNIFDRFNPINKPVNKAQQLREYTLDLRTKSSNQFPDNQAPHYVPKIVNLKYLPQKIENNTSQKIYFSFELLKRFLYIFILIGFILIIYNKKKNFDKNYLIFLITFFIIFGALVLMPLISIKYSLLRIYQQFLIILSTMSVAGTLFIFGLLKKKNIKLILTSIVFIIFFLFMSGFIPQLIGGSNGFMRLNNNFSLEYDVYYTHRTELISTSWLFINYQSNVYSDLYSNTKFSLSENKNNSHKLIKDILPQTINKDSYIYLSHSNIFQEIVFNRYQGSLLYYNLPTKFIDNNKNKIYSNGGSEISK